MTAEQTNQINDDWRALNSIAERIQALVPERPATLAEFELREAARLARHAANRAMSAVAASQQ